MRPTIVSLLERSLTCIEGNVDRDPRKGGRWNLLRKTGVAPDAIDGYTRATGGSSRATAARIAEKAIGVHPLRTGLAFELRAFTLRDYVSATFL